MLTAYMKVHCSESLSETKLMDLTMPEFKQNYKDMCLKIDILRDRIDCLAQYTSEEFITEDNILRFGIEAADIHNTFEMLKKNTFKLNREMLNFLQEREHQNTFLLEEEIEGAMLFKNQSKGDVDEYS